MDLDMIDVYQVMTYLKMSILDRQTPVNLEDKKVIEGDGYVFPTLYPNFPKISSIEIYYTGFLNNKVVLKFCSHEDGTNIIDTVETENIHNGKVFFDLDKNRTVGKYNKQLTGVKSIIIQGMNNNTINELFFKSKDYTIVYDEVISQLRNASNHIFNMIGCNQQSIPVPLKEYVYMISAGYIWLSIWENEANGMEDKYNYADRLIHDAEQGIVNYMSNCSNSSDESIGYYNKIRWGLKG